MDIKGPPSEETLADMLRRIVDAVHPLKVILFGSLARGQWSASSDVDLLVVMPDGVHRRRTAHAILASLAGTGLAKDVVVVTESDMHRYGDDPSLVLYPALREGKELYNATA
jgi:predicted nucleotidyltransferase